MKSSARTFHFNRSGFASAAGAGLLLAAAFPLPGLAGFAWIAPGLILAIALGTSGAQSFRIGYVAGFTHYLASLYWLLLIPYRWHGLPLAPALGWLALSAFMALYPATWVWLAVKASGAGCEGSGDDPSPWFSRLQKVSPAGWSQRTLWALVCAALWVAMEMAIARVFGGFPWNLLGASQYRIVPLIQVASVTGVYGVSFLCVWTSVSLLNAVIAILRRPALRQAWLGDMLLPGLAVFGLFAFGWHQLRHQPAPERTLKVTLVQPSIPQTLIWDPEQNMNRFQSLVQLSEEALTNQTDLLIWPEAGVPGLPSMETASGERLYRRDLYEPIAALAQTHKAWIILGADDVVVSETATNYFNGSLFISPDGKLADVYHKRSLVIFGEYIPLVRWLPFLRWFTPAGDGFTQGKGPVPFVLDGRGEPPGPAARTSVLICYEDVFPHSAREYAEPDTDFLVNITNDGWFGEGAAQWQQAACAIFRAVENGLPLVRCANTGLTCWVDASGRLREILSTKNGGVYGAGFMTVEIPLLNSGATRAPTFYNRHGDRFGWGCVGLAALAGARKFLARRRPVVAPPVPKGK